MFSEDSFFCRHKIITGILSFFVLLILVAAVFVGWRMKGLHRSYRVDFVKTGEGEPGVLQVGVAKRDITPELSMYDTYNDADNDNKYKPDKDTYTDVNKNGKFDPVWMAGFSSSRPAKGVHDPLWARAIAFRNNGLTVAMVTCDTIGIFQDQVIDLRKMIDPSLKIDHVILSSQHNHETPDTMGNWSGPLPMPWNFDKANMNRIKRACKDAIEEAVRGLEPADMICAEAEANDGLIDDSRQPIVRDMKIRCVRFIKHGSDGSLPTDTIATLVNWGNHPETLGGDNPLLTSDFSGYWRDGVERGVPEPNGELGIGGMCLYFQGMVGGLMTQLHTTVPHRNGVDKFADASYEKAQALGENLALLTLKALRGDKVWKSENPRLAVGAKTIFAPMEGLFRYAIMLGMIHPGFYLPNKARSEVDVARIGDLEILTVPGELYPEIAEGGIEAPAGQDFPIQPVEVPPLRGEMKGRMNMIFGLANDEIGYIIPKSQWDAVPPRAYKEKGQYGEENSGGPDVAPIVHHESLALLQRMHEALNLK
jgi:hypothetical protein